MDDRMLQHDGFLQRHGPHIMNKQNRNEMFKAYIHR